MGSEVGGLSETNARAVKEAHGANASLFGDLKGRKRIDALTEHAWEQRGKNIHSSLHLLDYTEGVLQRNCPSYRRGLAGILSKRAYLCYLGGNAREGLKPALNGYNLFKQLRKRSDVAHPATTVGLIYLELGQTEEAHQFLKEAYHIYSELNFQPGIGVAMANMGLLAGKCERNREAKSYYSQALAVMKETGHEMGVANMYNNLGAIAFKEKRFREALGLLRQSLRVNRRLGNHTFVGIVLGNIGACYVGLGKPNRAWQILDHADARHKMGGGSEPYPSSEVTRIRILGDKDSQHYRIAEAIRRAEALREKATDQETVLELLELIPELYTKAGLLHEAIRHYRGFIEFKKTAAIAEANLRADYAEVVANITSAREREAAERRQRVQLAKINRKLHDLNCRKDDFLRMIAHDLKTSAVVVQALSKMNLSEASDQASARAQDDRLTLMASNHILQLIENLKDVDAIESNASKRPFELVDSNSLLLQWIRQNRLEAKIKGITLLKRLDPNLPLVETNPLSLNRIIDNLLSNAIKFSPPNSTVILSSQLQEDRVHLTVRDQGPGIPPSEKKRLFKKFSRLSPKPTMGEASTGLGLFTAYRLSEILGATLTQENHPEGGAVFCLSFSIEPRKAPSK